MLYRYDAMDLTGKAASGTAEAGSPADARAQLRDRGLMAFRMEEAVPVPEGGRPARRGGRISWLNLSGRKLDLLSQHTRELALLLRTGVPPVQALGVLAAQVEDAAFRRILEDIASRVREGEALDGAFAAHPGYFTDLYVHVVRAGTQMGELPRVLASLSAYYQRQKKLRDRVVSALTYPALMSLVGLLVLIFLLTFVVPRVTAVLLEQKKSLPWPTEVLLLASGFVTEWWWAALGGVAILGIIARRLLGTDIGQRLADRATLRLPIVGKLFRKQAVARWAGTMSNLLASGIPVAQALSIVRGAVGNRALADEVGRLEKEVLEGSSLSGALKRSRLLPPSVGFMAGVGEEAGDLEGVLREVAQNYDEEVEVVSGRLTEILNPVLVVFLGLIVGFIVAAILLPITDFSKIQ